MHVLYLACLVGRIDGICWGQPVVHGLRLGGGWICAVAVLLLNLLLFV